MQHPINELIITQSNVYLWAKDTRFNYIYCNEKYAEAAGLDSPSQIVGMNDTQMPWRALADFFRKGDEGAFKGNIRLNVPEVEIMVDRHADILVSESQLFNKNQQCIGISGSFIDITGFQLIKKTGFYDATKKRYYLGDDLRQVWLTPREIDVFKSILLGYTAKRTATILRISPKTVESYIEKLRFKFNVNSKNELISNAIRLGLTQLISLQDSFRGNENI